MLKKLKSVTLKLSLTFLILMTAFTIIPAKSVEAKSLEITKVANKKFLQVANYLGYKYSIYPEAMGQIAYAKNKDYKDTDNTLLCLPENKNKKGKWGVCIYDTSVSVYGIKVNMSLSKADKILIKKGFKKFKNRQLPGEGVKIYTKKKNSGLAIELWHTEDNKIYALNYGDSYY